MNKISPYLKAAMPKAGYQLWVEFEDGVSGTIDLSTWRGKGVFEYWNKEENFKRFIITPDKNRMEYRDRYGS